MVDRLKATRQNIAKRAVKDKRVQILFAEGVNANLLRKSKNKIAGITHRETHISAPWELI